MYTHRGGWAYYHSEPLEQGDERIARERDFQQLLRKVTAAVSLGDFLQYIEELRIGNPRCIGPEDMRLTSRA
jgi:hypothetical protein